MAWLPSPLPQLLRNDANLFDNLKDTDRISLAKAKMNRVVDRFVYLLALHENNDIVFYSKKLSSQVPRSYAANLFVLIREALHQIELVRLCALWDGPDPDKVEHHHRHRAC